MFGQFSTTETQELQQAFNQGQEDLKNAIEAGDSEGEALARAQLEAVSKGAESEENRREAQKLNEEANSRLARLLLVWKALVVNLMVQSQQELKEQDFLQD